MIGKETQHFIAEATRTLQLSDTRKSDDVDDGLWLGCTSVNKEGRLCEVSSKEDSFPSRVAKIYRKLSSLSQCLTSTPALPSQT